MSDTIWLEDLRREARWDETLRRRPLCRECGLRIPFGRCLLLDDDTVLCESCLEDRLMEAELWEER